MAVKVNLEKCNGCSTCVEACPTEALSVADDKVKIDGETCIDCGVCVDECPVQALAL